ncbi:MAG: type II secretion system protein GspN [SAR324 cluster bacterium]|nr:type II secretion system protein GspN [SAR324 cluster bacterium]
MLKKLFFIFIAIFLFGLILFQSFWLSISEEKLALWLEFRLNQSLSQQIRLKVSKVHTHFWGLEIEQIKLENTLGQQELVNIDRVRIWFNLVSIFLSQELPYDFQLYGGDGSGVLGFFPNPIIKVQIVGLEPNWIPVIRHVGLVLSKPVLDLDGQVALDTLATKIQIKIKDLKVAGKKTVTTLPLDLPDTTLTTITGNIAMKLNQMDMTVETTGDFNSLFMGKIIVNWKRFQKSKLDLTLKADLAKPYQAKLGYINSIINNFGNEPGKISIRLTGTLISPRIKKL